MSELWGSRWDVGGVIYAVSAADAVFLPIIPISASQIAWAINLQISIMTTRTEKFQRKPRDGDSEPTEAAEAEEILRFSPEEEAVCITNPLAMRSRIMQC